MQNKTNLHDAGTVEVEIVSKNLRFIPKSARISMNFGDLAYSFQFSIPFDDYYFVPASDGIEVRVYVDEKFYCGGYTVARSEKYNEIQYNCQGYGYELAKSDCVSLNVFENNTTIDGRKQNNLTISSFILQTVSKNLVRRGIKEIFDNREMKRTEVRTRNIPIAFVTYDPQGYGEEELKSEESTKTQSKQTEKILDFINRFLKPKNIFIRCIGDVNSVSGSILDTILSNPTNFNTIRALPANAKIFVLELYKPTLSQTGGSIALDKNLKYSFYLANNFNSSSNIINQNTTYEIDYSNRYGAYLGVSKNNPETNAETNNVFVQDPTINDGTVSVVEYDINLNAENLKLMLLYELNKRIGQSISYVCTVLGFKQGLNIKNVNDGIDKFDMASWDINQNVVVDDRRHGFVGNQFLIKSLTLNWSSTGATTSLSCTLPNSYSQYEIEEDEFEESSEAFREYLRAKNILQQNILQQDIVKIPYKEGTIRLSARS